MTIVSVEVDVKFLDQARAAVGGGSNQEAVVHAIESLIAVLKLGDVKQE